MRDRGWLRCEEVEEGFISAMITTAGMDRLDYIRDQDALPRLLRFARSSMGLLLTSIVLPLVTAVLTTIVIGGMK
jgi:hypothetical protein